MTLQTRGKNKLQSAFFVRQKNSPNIPLAIRSMHFGECFLQWQKCLLTDRSLCKMKNLHTLKAHQSNTCKKTRKKKKTKRKQRFFCGNIVVINFHFHMFFFYLLLAKIRKKNSITCYSFNTSTLFKVRKLSQTLEQF